MAFEQFEKNMAIISALDDEPNDVGGLSAAELKAKFDEGGEALKEYINGTLIPALEAITAADIGAVPTTRKINEKALSENISLNAEDVGALPIDGSGVMTGPIRWVGSAGQMSISTNGYNLIISGPGGGNSIVITDDGYIITHAGVLDLNGDMYLHGRVELNGNAIFNASVVQTGTLTGPAEDEGILVDNPLIMDGNAIKELPNPIDAGDAANKTYADTKLSKTGDFMTGDFDLSANLNLYVDPENTYPHLILSAESAGDGTALLQLINKDDAGEYPAIVRGVAYPSQGQDAANKTYVDNTAVPKTTDTFKVYGTGAFGVPQNYDISQTVSGTTIAQRSPSGNLRTAAPLVDNDAVNKQTYDTGLALKADKQYVDDNAVFLATNLITNGDFHAGTAGWTVTGAALSNDVLWNGLQTVKCAPVSQTAYALKNLVSIDPTHKCYISVNCYISTIDGTLAIIDARNISDNSNISFGYADTSKLDTWQRVSTIVSGKIGGVRLYVGNANSLRTGVYYFSGVFLLDLTARFGAGNEPTAAEMDALMSYWPNSWFDGTANLAQASKMLPYLLASIRAKADKAQEAEIVPTLLNGFTNLSERTTRYCKDTMGFVHVEIYVTGNTIGAIIFSLPPGYRPSQTQYPVGLSTDTVASLVVSTNGNVYHNAGTVSGMLRFMFDFRAA